MINREKSVWTILNEFHFLKNLGLLGSALMFLTIPQPWPFSLGG